MNCPSPVTTISTSFRLKAKRRPVGIELRTAIALAVTGKGALARRVIREGNFKIAP